MNGKIIVVMEDMKKNFIITIDTEGDDLWKNKITRHGLKDITTENAKNLERFQILCEKYRFIPTYLTNYEMSQADAFRSMARTALRGGTCEIGMHMHAWNSPPIIHLPYNPKGTHTYIGEYEPKLQWQKMKYLKNTLEDVFQTRITSHRSGRWYLDKFTVRCLKKLGIYVDCTATPGVSWGTNIGNRQYGTDYSGDRYSGDYMLSPRNIHKKGNSGIYEVPPTILPRYTLTVSGIKKEMLWLRPGRDNLQDMLWVKDRVKKDWRLDHIEFMIHSSELTAGTSPYFPNEKSIHKLYEDLEILFSELAKDFNGIGLTDHINRKYGIVPT